MNLADGLEIRAGKRMWKNHTKTYKFIKGELEHFMLLKHLEILFFLFFIIFQKNNLKKYLNYFTYKTVRRIGEPGVLQSTRSKELDMTE